MVGAPKLAQHFFPSPLVNRDIGAKAHSTMGNNPKYYGLSSFLFENWDGIMRRKDERTGQQAQNGDTTRAVMMDMCPVELERPVGGISERPVGGQGLH